MMSPGMRKLGLTVHIVFSVGAIGAVSAFIALAIAGLVSPDAGLVRAAYPAMELTTWFVIVPLVVASLLTGIVQSLGTTWGLFRYYWVVVKLALTVFATLVLLIHTQPIGTMASVALEPAFDVADYRGLQVQLVAASIA